MRSPGHPLARPFLSPARSMPGAFSPDGKTFLAAYDSGEARLWDMATGTPLDRRFPHPGAVSALALQPRRQDAPDRM